jgi:nucleoid DNA-binding protein
MNKQELVKTLGDKFELTNVKAVEIVKFILESITKSLSKNKPFAFVGFGTFAVKKRKARNGRNPQTGESIKIPSRKVIRFAAGKFLKETVNKSKLKI